MKTDKKVIFIIDIFKIKYILLFIYFYQKESSVGRPSDKLILKT